MATAKARKLGKLNLDEMKKLINKKAGVNLAHDLTGRTRQKLRSGSQQAQGG